MKTKKFIKKLKLSKKTIAHLKDNKMSKVYGGNNSRQTDCPTEGPGKMCC
jgi:natural product precursor